MIGWNIAERDILSYGTCMDFLNFVVEEFRHLIVNGCTAKYGCIVSLLSIICLGAIVCSVNTTGFVSVCACRVCDAFIASCATVH